ncbi:dioxygenase family protein [Chitinilyticum piscinae]|uniref:Dioxygenase n=1 Tax=Chitinilyticum piscinae TaxID=2866724 RepID=A0A8J7K0I2_9NEIS|nr:class III extradiol ring-cleavage dioxygenase [Chitinilyticum piscinae]MBE9608096.1 dioxygenase [Chitinilyticum piscinae]
MARMPALFVSHGAPTLLFDAVPARDFLRGLPARLPRPRAIVLVSAHDLQSQLMVGTAAQWQEWHDFGGFPAELYAQRYRPPGDPELAAHLISGLRAGGLDAVGSQKGLLDHGAWVPLKLAWPDADIPVVTLSLAGNLDSAGHLRIGQVLAGCLPEDVLLLASGSMTHNLREVFGMTDAASGSDYVSEFAAWVMQAAAADLPGELAQWQQRAPHARRAHPSPEHFLPLLVARGAAGVRAEVECWHDSATFGVLGMHALAFVPQPNP